jgi:cytochrome c-type biogenesis protein CcmH
MIGLNKRIVWGSLCALMCLFMAAASHAVIETYQFSNDSLELRYKALSVELRCPKCQNQNIADSNAPIAQDLRKLLYKQLEAGATDDEILDYMVSRYGEFVRYKPSFEGVTLLLWLMPILLLLGAIGLLVAIFRGSAKSAVAADEISTQEQVHLDELLAKSKKAEQNR